MGKVYFELRKQSAKGTESIAADIMRHLHARQHLGKAVIVCDNPAVVYATSRKQWLKLSRAVQKMRAATLNADKILKYTHTITHMQGMRFTHKPLPEDLKADVYFITPEQCTMLPLRCYSLYLSADVDTAMASRITEQLPANGLIVDYRHTTAWTSLGLAAKSDLEQQVEAEWQRIEQFLAKYGIDPRKLIHKEVHDIDALDDALDMLLSIPQRFMDIAYQFQQALALARPLRLSRSIRESYDAVVLLAHRVQALSSGTFTQQFLESYYEDDTFFLYDIGCEKYDILQENPAPYIAHHQAAGRQHLAKALRYRASRSCNPTPAAFVIHEPLIWNYKPVAILY